MSYILNYRKGGSASRPKFFDGQKMSFNGATAPLPPYYNYSEIETSDLKDFTRFFSYSPLTQTPIMNTNKMVFCRDMFNGCTNLRVITSPLYMGNISVPTYDMFSWCYALEEVRFKGVIFVNMDLSSCFALSTESLLSLAFCLDIATKTLTLSTVTAITDKLNLNVRLNQSGDGLEVCNAGDTGDLGTLAQYITNKGWTITQV